MIAWGLLLIVLGLSGQFVLRGTSSGLALAAVGGALVLVGILRRAIPATPATPSIRGSGLGGLSGPPVVLGEWSPGSDDRSREPSAYDDAAFRELVQTWARRESYRRFGSGLATSDLLKMIVDNFGSGTPQQYFRDYCRRLVDAVPDGEAKSSRSTGPYEQTLREAWRAAAVISEGRAIEVADREIASLLLLMWQFPRPELLHALLTHTRRKGCARRKAMARG